jgi:hypothetical protein
VLVGTSLVGCGGGTLHLGDGGVDSKTYPDATHTDSNVEKKDSTTDTTSDAAPVVPPIGPGSKLIAKGTIDLIGSGADSCTNQVPPGGDRWCGFTKVSADLVNNELWVVNATKVAAGVAVQCDSTVADPNCVRLSTGLYQDPSNAFRIHAFDGDTLTFSEVPSRSAGGFLGNILAWRPGMAAPVHLTGNAGMACNGHALTKAIICLENPTPDPTNTFVHTAELHAGTLDDLGPGKTLPLVDTVILVAMADPTGVSKWGARLTPDGKSVAWSTRATDDGTEDLKWQNLGDDTSRVTVAADVHSWTVSSDSKRWYWLKTYNYSTTRAPSGTLQAATYPSGATPVTLAMSAGDFDEAGAGVLYRTKVSNDVGTLLLTPDATVPATVTMLDTNVEFVFGVTKDGKSSIYTKNIQSPQTNVFLFDLYLGNAAGNMPCTLTNMPTGFLNATFVGSTAVAWARYNSKTNIIEGVATTIADCKTTLYANDVYDWTGIGDEGLVFLDNVDPDPAIFEATLRYSKFPLPATGTVVQQRAGLEYSALLPSLSAVVYVITSNTSADGIYLNATLPFTVTATPPPPVDGGMPDTGTADTGMPDAGGGGDADAGSDTD